MDKTTRRGGTVRDDTAHALLARVARAQVEGRVPSLTVGVVRDGELVWSASRGNLDGTAGSPEPTVDTQYRIGSITKGFTAVLVLRLRDEGLLDLDDPLDTHVPGTAYGDVTIRDLLSHASGLAAEPPGPWWERSEGRPWDDLAPRLGPELILRGHGQFHYSNPGYALLGRVVEGHRGRSWFEALRDEVLAPLGMTRTTYGPVAPYAPGLAVHPYADATMPEVVQDLGAMAPAGQLWSTVADLACWAAFVGGHAGGRGGTEGADGSDNAAGPPGVLAADTIAEMRAVAVLADDPAWWQTGYGLGFQVLRSGDRELVGHGGSVPGYLAFLVTDPERGTGVVELANATGGSPFSGIDLLALLQQHEPYVTPEWRATDDTPSELLDLVGLWHWGPNPILLRLRGADQIELGPIGTSRTRASRFRRSAEVVGADRAGADRAGADRAGADGAWVGLDGYWRGETLRVVRRADGTPSHLDLGTFVWTREPYEPGAPIPGGVHPEGWSRADEGVGFGSAVDG